MFSFEQNLYGTGLFWCKGDRVTNYSPQYPGWCSGMVSFRGNTCPCIYLVDAVVHLEGLHVFSAFNNLLGLLAQPFICFEKYYQDRSLYSWVF